MIKRIILVTLVGLASIVGYSQGCSDAGFCTIDGFKPSASDSTKKITNQIKIGAYVGRADHAITVYGSYLEYTKQLNDKWGFDVKLTNIVQNGNGISTFGFSDVFVNGKYKINDSWKAVIGVKVPLTNADRELDNLPLPMDYQSSLGTFDLIAGFAFKWKKLELIAGYQQPLTQNNNQFFSSLYPDGSPLRSFQSTNQFKRSGDVMLRLSYPIKLNDRFKLTPSLLPIYHIANDKYTDELGVEREILGSVGLTLNGNLYLDYEINDQNSIQLNTGNPFIVRENRPDGLTRSYIITLEYKYRF